ncbi:YrbL family protein [Bordetella sp. 2513F-2]
MNSVLAPWLLQAGRVPFYVSPFETLDLSGSVRLAAGAERDIYEHPSDPSLLIKIINHARTREQPSRRRWHKQFHREDAHRVFLSEITEYVATSVHRWDEGGNMLMARIAGLVLTSRGMGLAVEKIVGDDGTSMAPTLAEVVKRDGFSGALRARLDAFFHDLAEAHVVFNDVGGRNIVVGRNAQGREGMYLIDGYGPKQLLPLYAWSKTLNRRRLDRKYAEMRAKLERSAAAAGH